MDLEEYNQNFYQSRNNDTKFSAHTILSILLGNIPKVKSAVDIGCGVGTWLAALKENGVQEIQGFDGSWVDQNLLVIPKENFKAAPLHIKLDLNKKYDLVICLEVAEHLPITFAKDFINSLTSFSDFVLFSAAIPNQGGNHHINEQWPEYWVNHFQKNDFVVFDFIRPKIWEETKIPFWYKQNILFFAKKNRLSEIKAKPTENGTALRMIHPQLLEQQIAKSKVGVRGSFSNLLNAIKNYISKKK